MLSDQHWNEDDELIHPLCESCGLRRAVRLAYPIMCAVCLHGPIHEEDELPIVELLDVVRS